MLNFGEAALVISVLGISASVWRVRRRLVESLPSINKGPPENKTLQPQIQKHLNTSFKGANTYCNSNSSHSLTSPDASE